jgi:cell division GTPase FtsZ
LYTITASRGITIDEVQEVGEIIADTVHPEANAIVGVVYDENAGDEMRITVIATGIDAPSKQVAVQSPARCDAKSDVSAVEHKRQVLEHLKVHTCAPREEGFIIDEEEFDLPTFIRRQTD